MAEILIVWQLSISPLTDSFQHSLSSVHCRPINTLRTPQENDGSIFFIFTFLYNLLLLDPLGSQYIRAIYLVISIHQSNLFAYLNTLEQSICVFVCVFLPHMFRTRYNQLVMTPFYLSPPLNNKDNQDYQDDQDDQEYKSKRVQNIQKIQKRLKRQKGKYKKYRKYRKYKNTENIENTKNIKILSSRNSNNL